MANDQDPYKEYKMPSHKHHTPGHAALDPPAMVYYKMDSRPARHPHKRRMLLEPIKPEAGEVVHYLTHQNQKEQNP
jgi:hypothetical protein